MRYRYLILSAVALLLITDLPVAAQYPGGYPPGTYPPGTYPPGTYPQPGVGLPHPGRKKKSKDKDQAEPLSTLKGMLRKLDDGSLIVEAEDTRIVTMKRTSDTKFLKDGDELKPGTLKPGDHLEVEYRQDEEGYMYAVHVNLEKEGTAEERAAASEPVDVLTKAPGKGDDDRPVQRRKDSPAASAAKDDDDDAAAPAAKPAGAPPASKAPAAAAAQPPDIVPPEAGLDLDHIPTSTGSRQSTDEDAPPELKRGKPKARRPSAASPEEPSSGPPQVARNIPAAGPEPIAVPPPTEDIRPASEGSIQPSGLPPAPPPDPRIEKTRQVATEFTQTLPDYVCQEQMARFESATHVVNWQPVDIVSTEVVYEKGKERYRNLQINGKAVKKKMEELSGAWSTGEFGTVLVDVFSPSTAADFRYKKTAIIGGRSSFEYDFDVDHEHSHWNIVMPSQSVLPAYRGTVWIDKETQRVLRIEMQANHLPQEFPADKVESATDYEFIRIGEGQFLLPVHAETLTCLRGTNMCSHNVIDFRNYHKYAGEATIHFDK
ncbi:MAG TPA: hypothetical protein VLX58_06500 [Bryobacteraceae bacterium]|nr:hypothetical protein [Bryobacteraceae bacterium]